MSNTERNKDEGNKSNSGLGDWAKIIGALAALVTAIGAIVSWPRPNIFFPSTQVPPITVRAPTTRPFTIWVPPTTPPPTARVSPTTPPPTTPPPTAAIVPEDCLPYNPANLRIVNEGASGWLLTDGVSRMLLLDSQQDAQNALILAKRYTKQCFIGRGNTRSNRKDYIVEYWE